MVKKPLKSRFKLNLNTFTFAFLGLFFVLFICFCIFSHPVGGGGLSIDLARVNSPHPVPYVDKYDAMVVAIQRDGSIFSGAEKIVPDKLPELIRKGVSKGSERKVYVKADGRVPSGIVNEVVDGIRASGIENIAFLVEQRKPVTPLPAAVGVTN